MQNSRKSTEAPGSNHSEISMGGSNRLRNLSAISNEMEENKSTAPLQKLRCIDKASIAVLMLLCLVWFRVIQRL
ncbi:hypothetical protein CEXT_437521 [Caerostris extrusa]|uniref:Uncharacterized protein n=1 Tax=Caerostris extrusa TaxID=172846 RepID=A0AAV4RPR6_CAEEX|nr:hypothetical protein CEXT_437521 [Caerostris extrusa]